jgi:hypothetical protein
MDTWDIYDRIALFCLAGVLISGCLFGDWTPIFPITAALLVMAVMCKRFDGGK